MRTRLTDLLGIRHPIVLPGMTYIAVPRLVAAVSEAGGLGILAAGALTPEGCRQAIQEVRRLTAQPFGVGCSLGLPGAADCARVALQEQVPLINVSMGKGDWVIEGARRYGGKVIATIASEAHARSALAAGVDGLIVTGHEAAAHGGAVTSMVLIPTVRDLTDLPLIAAGGIADGRGLVAALALGADAVAMGTRFACASESPVHAGTQALIVSRQAQDTLYSPNFDTWPCRVMDTPGGRRAMARPLSPPVALMRSLRAARELQRPMGQLLRDVAELGLVQAVKVAYFGAATLAMRKAIHEGNHDEGVQLIGQSQGLVHDVAPVADIVARVLAEAVQVRQRIGTL
jgi:enoyl-[acyl-carrier protein] reductase II